MTELNECSIPTQSDGEKRFKIFGVELAYLYLFGIIVAFLGWFVENVAKIVVGYVQWGGSYFDSRFHFLPFISPYALIPLALHIALGSPNELRFFGKRVFKEKNKKTVILSNIASFLLMSFFVFAGELVIGNLWDILFDVELWDYTADPTRVTQYTSLVTALGFGVFAYIIFKFIYTPILGFIRKKVNYRVAKYICLTLGIAIALDTVRLVVSMAIFGNDYNFNFWEFRDGSFYWTYLEKLPK